MKYKDAGVDIDAANAALERIKALVRSTYTKGVSSEPGLFAGAYSLASAGIRDPLLLSSMDGVGTKLKIAFAARKFKSVGTDIVSHCCNDVLVHAAQPIFFLDYIGIDKIEVTVLEELVSGMAEECINWGCALIGGETAEMPGFYNKGEFDVVGCAVGVVEKSDFVDGADIRSGDVLIGLPSTGLHTNGFSLARKILFEKKNFSVEDSLPELGCTIEEALLVPHRSYLRPVRLLLAGGWVRGMAHITGGGFFDNITRILPDGLQVHIRKGTWPILPVFGLLRRWGEMEDEEAFRTFNMGVGFVVFVREKDVSSAVNELLANDEKAFVIGEVRSGKKGVHVV
ncbi:MAG: phosphoribosylformylglycinamidine cyclo-ligase [Candidatus Eisenbacteria bacterium]|nr:phosphoribosylformylglycinamidine cyclo-ligase [Candidatus Eisenbacteria bacterium]